VADILASELGRDRAWRDSQAAGFTALARGYVVAPDQPVVP
jgi:hypothetical protein